MKKKALTPINMRFMIAIIPLIKSIHLHTDNFLIPLNSFLRVYYSLPIFSILEVAQYRNCVFAKKWEWRNEKESLFRDKHFCIAVDRQLSNGGIPKSEY